MRTKMKTKTKLLIVFYALLSIYWTGWLIGYAFFDGKPEPITIAVSFFTTAIYFVSAVFDEMRMDLEERIRDLVS